MLINLWKQKFPNQNNNFQMKYYIAFAENSIEGHLESGPRRPVGDHQQQIRDLIEKLQNAKVSSKSSKRIIKQKFINGFPLTECYAFVDFIE